MQCTVETIDCLCSGSVDFEDVGGGRVVFVDCFEYDVAGYRARALGPGGASYHKRRASGRTNKSESHERMSRSTSSTFPRPRVSGLVWHHPRRLFRLGKTTSTGFIRHLPITWNTFYFENDQVGTSHVLIGWNTRVALILAASRPAGDLYRPPAVAFRWILMARRRSHPHASRSDQMDPHDHAIAHRQPNSPASLSRYHESRTTSAKWRIWPNSRR